MKKIVLYTATILLLTIITVGGTYAFFSVTAGSKDVLSTMANKFEVIYTGDAAFDGPLNFSSDKEGGINKTVNIRVSEDSVLGKVDIYFQIEEITEQIANDKLVWEVYKNNETIASKTGYFNQCGENKNEVCKSGDRLYLIEGYQLSIDNTAFTIYLWLDGSKATNDVIGASFKGFIGAQSENITGHLG